MKIIANAIGRIIVICALFIISGCASIKPFDSSLPLLTISKAEKKDLRGFGNTFDTNPYIEPSSLIRGKLNEFFVIKLEFNLPQNSRIHIIAEGNTNEGVISAKAYDMYALEDFWNSVTYRESENDAKFQLRISNIKRSCIPSFSFEQNAGQSVLFFPFIGKNPIPRPSKIYVQVVVENLQSYNFEYLLN